MTTALQLRRGTTAQHETFTGLNGEVTVDTTAKSLRVHDGFTIGGFLLAKLSDIVAGVRYDISQVLSAAQKLCARTNIGALVDPSANGMVAKTGSGTAKGRTITAGTGISVTNGDGVSGDPTISNSGITSIGGMTGDMSIGDGLVLSDHTLSLGPATSGKPITSTLYTSSTTWTKPQGCTSVRVRLIGGGGGGGAGSSSYAGGRGGTSGYVEGVLDVRAISSLPIVIGSGGNGGSSSAGGSGGASSFGAFTAGGGGGGGKGGSSADGTIGTYGTAAGGSLNITSGSFSGTLDTYGYPGVGGQANKPGTAGHGGALLLEEFF